MKKLFVFCFLLSSGTLFSTYNCKASDDIIEKNNSDGLRCCSEYAMIECSPGKWKYTLATSCTFSQTIPFDVLCVTAATEAYKAIMEEQACDNSDM